MGEIESSRYQGVLRDPGRGFLAGLLPSIGLHLLMVGCFILLGFEGRERRNPLIDKDIYMVSAVVLPKADGLPDKATAPTTPPAGESGTAEAPPIVEDEMVLKQEKPERKKEPESKPDPKRSKKEPDKKRPTREELLARAADTEESDRARFATDPDGEEGDEISWEAFSGKKKSPYQRRLEGWLLEKWNPSSRAGKFVHGRGNIDSSLKVVVEFRIKSNGGFVSPSIYSRSGDTLYDQSCLMAVSRLRRFDPPPEGEPRIFRLLCAAEELE